MPRISLPIPIFVGLMAFDAAAQGSFQRDILKTSQDDLEITFIGHASLMFTFNGKVMHIDPFSNLAEYSQLPQADILLITHEHRDHLDLKAVAAVRTDKTVVVLTKTCAAALKGGIIMKNGDSQTVGGLKIEAVPAYNLVHMRSEGVPFHPKGIGNGYVITFGDKRVYVAGDTENIPEMKKLAKIDCAFLPMNLPYTMNPAMVAEAAKAVKPKILYPYHYGDTDTSILEQLMKDIPQVEIRIRRMK